MCYTSKIISHYWFLYITQHSMIISMLKYFIIVQDKKLRLYKDQIKTTFLWINILHPILQISLQLSLNPGFFLEYGGYKYINRCLGQHGLYKTTFLSMCDSAEPLENSFIDNMAYILKLGVCKVQVLLLYIIAFNFLDMIFYCRIFTYMRR